MNNKTSPNSVLAANRAMMGANEWPVWGTWTIVGAAALALLLAGVRRTGSDIGV